MKLLMKYSLLFFLILFFADKKIYSQVFTEQELDLKENAEPVILGKNDSSFIVLYNMNPSRSDVRRKFETECFNFSFKSLWRSKQIKLPDNFSEKNAVYFQSRVLFLNSEYDSYKQEYAYEIRKQVLSNGTLNENADTVFRIGIHEENKKLRKQSYGFDCIASVSGNKLMFIYSNDYTDAYKEGFSFRTIDKDFKLSEIKKIELIYSDPLCNIADIIYDDSANRIYLLTKMFDIPDVKKRTVREYKLFSFDTNGNLITSVDLELTTTKLAVIKIKSNDDKIFVIGVTKSEYEKASGLVFKSINKKTFKIENSTSHLFSDSVSHVVNHESRFFKRINFAADNYDNTDFVIDEKNIYWIAEYNTFGKNRLSAAALTGAIGAGVIMGIASGGVLIFVPAGQSKPKFLSCNLLFEKINFNGDFISEQVIQKKEENSLTGCISHLLLKNNSDCCIAFNYDKERENINRNSRNHIETIVIPSNADDKNYDIKKINLKNRFLFTNASLSFKPGNFIFITGNFDTGQMYLTNYSFH